MAILSKRNALVGWLALTVGKPLAKRFARRKLRSLGSGRGRTAR